MSAQNRFSSQEFRVNIFLGLTNFTQIVYPLQQMMLIRMKLLSQNRGQQEQQNVIWVCFIHEQRSHWRS